MSSGALGSHHDVNSLTGPTALLAFPPSICSSFYTFLWLHPLSSYHFVSLTLSLADLCLRTNTSHRRAATCMTGLNKRLLRIRASAFLFFPTKVFEKSIFNWNNLGKFFRCGLGTTQYLAKTSSICKIDFFPLGSH